MRARGNELLEFTEARRIVLASCALLGAERVDLSEALWRTLAEDVVSGDDVPSADNSAMDGFAVVAADTREATDDKPVALRVVGEIAAGPPPHATVRREQAARIMTGGVMPDGADAVVIVERAREKDGRVLIFSPAKPGQNVRRKGEDIRKGKVVYRSGELVRAAELGVLASLGFPEVSVFRRPVVAIVTTGDELIDVAEELSPGMVRSSNTYTLLGQVREAGGEAEVLGKASDREDELESMMKCGRKADMLITSGGVSAGEYDLVPKVAERIGEVRFHGVAMKPGSPMAFGRIGETVWFGLPGNPVASMVCFEMFVRPAILKMTGRRRVFRPEVKVRTGTGITRSARVHFMRVSVEREDEELVAYPAREQGSGILTSVSVADGLLIVEAGEAALPRGTELTMQVLRAGRLLERTGPRERREE